MINALFVVYLTSYKLQALDQFLNIQKVAHSWFNEFLLNFRNLLYNIASAQPLINNEALIISDSPAPKFANNWRIHLFFSKVSIPQAKFANHSRVSQSDEVVAETS